MDAGARAVKFNHLDNHLEWKNETRSLKVPIVQLKVFPTDMQTALIRCKFSMYFGKYFSTLHSIIYIVCHCVLLPRFKFNSSAKTIIMI